MKAVRFIEVGKPAEIADIPQPKPGPGQVLIKVGGAGVCHSDLHILHEGVGIPGPYTLGHENAGWIAELGEGVTGWEVGEAVAVYGPWGCGFCPECTTSNESYCENVKLPQKLAGGIGHDGGMADYMIVPSTRLLTRLGNLDPREAAPLSDAALTPYHAIKRALPLLTPGTTTLVLGVGGLGHMAIQILRAMSATRIIAGDVDDTKLAHARELGADVTVNTRDSEAALKTIQEVAGKRGCIFVIDCVGVQPTVTLASKAVGMNSQLTVVGLGGGKIDWSAYALPFGCSLMTPYWGSRKELMEVIALAQDGRIKAETSFYKLDEANEVYEKLEKGQIKGRAVLVP
jgi:propanol-preferring alcohol dehydrogenase